MRVKSTPAGVTVRFDLADGGGGVSPLQKGLQFFQNGSGSRDIPVTPQFLTKPLQKRSRFKRVNEQNPGSEAVVPESGLLSLDDDRGDLLDESVLLQCQDRPAGDLAELKYPPYPGGILL